MTKSNTRIGIAGSGEIKQGVIKALLNGVPGFCLSAIELRDAEKAHFAFLQL